MAAQTLSLVVYDLDGTLVEPELEHFIGEAARVFAAMGLPPRTPEELTLGLTTHTLFAALDEPERGEIEREFWSRYDHETIPPPRAIEGALTTLEETIARGYTVAIATARTVHTEALRELLAPTGLLKRVSSLSTWAGTGWRNKQEQLRRLCAELGTAPEQGVMVGDSPDDIASARAVGFGLRIGVLGGLCAEGLVRDAAPCEVVWTVVEVPGVLDRYR